MDDSAHVQNGLRIIQSTTQKGTGPDSELRMPYVPKYLLEVLDIYYLVKKYHSSSGSDGKVSACNAEDLGLIPWVRKIPWRRKWEPTPVLLPEKFREWRSLVGYSPWGHKESDMTERLHFLFMFLEELYINTSNPLVSRGLISLFVFLHLKT